MALQSFGLQRFFIASPPKCLPFLVPYSLVFCTFPVP